MWISDKWKDFEIIDCGNGEKVERWGDKTLVRPDPQAIWSRDASIKAWFNAHAHYNRSSSGGGKWNIKNLPQQWQIKYNDLTFNIKPMSFKHTGLFPEQSDNWDFASRMISSSDKKVNVLNLFAYTGGATLACAKAGASVCHVDASKGMVSWARENAASSGLSNAPIRWIVDDCKKFIEREIRRGRKYDAIIMDPPSYGRGPNGEVWKIEEHVGEFIELASQLLSDDPLFVIINSYSTGLAPSVMGYILARQLGKKYTGKTESSELGLPVSSTGLALPCGNSTRWINTNR